MNTVKFNVKMSCHSEYSVQSLSVHVDICQTINSPATSEISPQIRFVDDVTNLLPCPSPFSSSSDLFLPPPSSFSSSCLLLLPAPAPPPPPTTLYISNMQLDCYANSKITFTNIHTLCMHATKIHLFNETIYLVLITYI